MKLNPGCHVKSSIQQEEDSFYQQLWLSFSKKLVIWCNQSAALYGAETWTHQKKFRNRVYFWSSEMF